MKPTCSVEQAELDRWWSRTKGVGFCISALLVHLLSWVLDLSGSDIHWVQRSGALLVLAAAYLELSTINADEKLSVWRRIWFGKVDKTVFSPSLTELEPRAIHLLAMNTKRENFAQYLNDEYLRKRRLNISRWALALGGYGTVVWAYGDLVVS